MSELTHFDEGGAVRMVDVSGKAETRRVAVASGRVRLSAENELRSPLQDATKTTSAIRNAWFQTRLTTKSLRTLSSPFQLS
jgi:molybdenum cofactor biosynthesis enzyme